MCGKIRKIDRRFQPLVQMILNIFNAALTLDIKQN